jgi:hypothetical protein
LAGFQRERRSQDVRQTEQGGEQIALAEVARRDDGEEGDKAEDQKETFGFAGP